MSSFAIHGSKVLKTCIAIGFAYYALPKMRDHFLAYMQPQWMSAQHNLVHDLKESVFEYLNDYRLNMSNPEQPIRILEIGAGDGSNLEQYPDRTRLVVVEPSKNFRFVLEKKIEEINFRRRNLNSSSFDPSLKLEAWYALKAENMAMYRGDQPNPAKLDGKVKTGEEYLFPDGDYPAGMFNAFVSTYVLCSVDDMERVLMNATSLVQPGGLLLMIEHVKPAEKWLDIFCYILQPFWRLFMGHCRLRRKPHDLVRDHPKLSKAWEILYCEERDYPPNSVISPIKRNVGLVARRLVT